MGYLYLSGMCFGVAPGVNIKKLVFKRDWTTCSNMITIPRFSTQHIGGGEAI